MSVQPNACDFCRRRKLKCSRVLPICDKCIKYKNPCVYSAQHRKISLTKANFQYLQRRTIILEKALARLIPERTELNHVINQVDAELGCQKRFDSEPIPNNGARNEENNDSDSDYIKEEEYLINEIEEIEDMVWYEPDNDVEINDLSPTQLADLMSGLTIGNSDNSRNPIYYGISSPNGIIKFLKESDVETRKILENFKPISTNIDYKSNLLLVKQIYGELFQDNPTFQRELFESFFNIYHKCYPILEKSSFLNDYYNLSSKSPMSKQCLKILIFTVLSIGSFCKYGDNSVIDLLYYKRVKQELKKVDIMEYNSFYLLEALTLLGNYCQKRNKPNTGFNYHGICFRMAISFGLHREVAVNTHTSSPNTNIYQNTTTEEYKTLKILERRRRLFWGLYILDIGHCITLGRPSLGPLLETVNIKYPMIDFDQDTDTIDSFKSELHPSVIEGFVLEGKLLKISTKINNVITRLDGNLVKRIKTLNQLNEEINEFINEMPYYFKDLSEMRVPQWFLFRRVKIIWRYKNMKILMFRSFIWQLNKRKPTSPGNETKDDTLNKLIIECIGICVKEALETIDSINNFIKVNTLNNFSAWYPIYFIYHAVLVPILLINHNNQEPSDYTNNLEMNDLSTYNHYIKLSQDTLLLLKPYNNNITCNLINLIEILSRNIRNNDLLINEIFNKDLNELNFELESINNGGYISDTILDINPINFNLDSSYQL